LNQIQVNIQEQRENRSNRRQGEFVWVPLLTLAVQVLKKGNRNKEKNTWCKTDLRTNDWGQAHAEREWNGKYF